METPFSRIVAQVIVQNQVVLGLTSLFSLCLAFVCSPYLKKKKRLLPNKHLKYKIKATISFELTKVINVWVCLDPKLIYSCIFTEEVVKM